MTVTDRIDIRIEAAAWDGAVENAAAICRQAALAALAVAPVPWRDAALSVLLSDNATLQGLNRAYRGRDEATNVLSFAQVDVELDAWPEVANGPVSGPVLLGDIAIAYEVTAHEADEAEKPLVDHLRHLVVHGVLHLLGYDHDVDPDAETMEAVETRVLAGLGVPDPHEGAMEPRG